MLFNSIWILTSKLEISIQLFGMGPNFFCMRPRLTFEQRPSTEYHWRASKLPNLPGADAGALSVYTGGFPPQPTGSCGEPVPTGIVLPHPTGNYSAYGEPTLAGVFTSGSLVPTGVASHSLNISTAVPNYASNRNSPNIFNYLAVYLISLMILI